METDKHQVLFRPSIAVLRNAKHWTKAGKLLLFVMVLILLPASAAAQQKNSCIECHVRLEGKIGDPARSIKDDIHLSKGLSCRDCHGGDPTQDDKHAAKDPQKGYLGRPKNGRHPCLLWQVPQRRQLHEKV